MTATATAGVVLSSLVSVVLALTLATQEPRQAIIDAETQYSLGGKVLLSPKEREADAVLRELKAEELARDNGTGAPGMHFFTAKPLIEQSAVFKVLRSMPKGAALHLHNTAGVSSKWVIGNLTYRSEAMLCSSQGQYYFTVRKLKECESIATLRKQNGSEAFDQWLESLINLKLQPRTFDANELWKNFEACFNTMKGLLQYKPFFEAYHQRLLYEFHRDKVSYLELRSSLFKLYDADDKEYDEVQVVSVLQDVVKQFSASNPNFFGVKVIYSKHRQLKSEAVTNVMQTYGRLSAQYPTFVVGLDFVGQEDNAVPLKTLLKNQASVSGVKYFFHAGETVRYRSMADLNLVDAVLHNARRIGHGYSLYRHPLLWHYVKKKGIALEVCPISNQVLGLVRDLRNHPASFYVSHNVPFVVSSDDPGFWDAEGVSYDFYYAFMSMAPSDAGISFLKQLVWDSVKYSVLTATERQQMGTLLDGEWSKFIADLCSSHQVGSS